MIEIIAFWALGVVTWLIIFIWNTDNWNKSRGDLKQKGLSGPVKAYWVEHALYVAASLAVTLVFLALVAFDQLPFKLVIGEDITAGKLFLAVFIAFNIEALVNGIRRSKSDKQP